MGTQPPMTRHRHRQSNQPPSVTLPDDLNGEILSWLPVKPLMKMKCVSKSWNNLISNPKFVKIHLNRSARNSLSYLVSYKKFMEDVHYSFVPFSVSCLLENPSVPIPLDPYYRLIDKDCCQVIGSCNGLVCLLGYDEDQRKESCLRLWNPATRTISDKFGYFRDDVYGLKYWKCEFGYNNSTDTYKVVALKREGFNYSKTTEVRVLSFGNNIWRSVQSFVAKPVQSIFSDTLGYGGVHLNGTINWLAVDINGNLQFVIISLNLGTETHTHILPPLDALKVSSVLPRVCALMGSLCFYHDFERTDIVIWKMKEFGDEKSWTQFLKFSYHNLLMNSGGLSCFHLYENGDTLVFTFNQEDHAILYNLRNNKVVKTRVNKNICWSSINNYVESLVSSC